MVFYVTESGEILHENDVFYYKGKYWNKDSLKVEAQKDNKTLKNWGFE